MQCRFPYLARKQIGYARLIFAFLDLSEMEGVYPVYEQCTSVDKGRGEKHTEKN